MPDGSNATSPLSCYRRGGWLLSLDHQTAISRAGDDRAQVARLDNESSTPVEALLVFEMLADPDRSWAR